MNHVCILFSPNKKVIFQRSLFGGILKKQIKLPILICFLFKKKDTRKVFLLKILYFYISILIKIDNIVLFSQMSDSPRLNMGGKRSPFSELPIFVFAEPNI